MSKTLFNPTNEEMKFQWGGTWTTVKPGEEVEMDDARANQGLSELGRRGMVQFSYKEGLDRELRRQRCEEGVEANKDFKRKQIMDFNSLNDQRKQSKLPYLTPQKQIKDYAKELGMELYEPYSASDEAKREGMVLRETIRKKDDMLKEQSDAISAMQQQIANLTNMVGSFMNFAKQQGGQATPAVDLNSALEMPTETKTKRSK